MKLYIDIDDVIVETTRTLAETARAHYGKNIDFEDMTSFDLQRSLELGPDEFEKFMSEVHEPTYLRELEPVENAKEALVRWHDSGARAGRSRRGEPRGNLMGIAFTARGASQTG